MTTFNDRERAFENKFAHDAEMQFKAVARRNKRIGIWAAGLMGKSAAEAEAYGLDLVRIDFEEPGPENVIRKLVADLAGRADEATVRARMEELLAQVKVELYDES
jgi:hypothetical protein